MIKQQSRVLHGTFTTSKATESFIAVIGMDNKSFFLADEDGIMDGTIVNKENLHAEEIDLNAAITDFR